jgi:hypothetical protein
MAFISEEEKKEFADALRSIADLALAVRKTVYDPSGGEYRLQLSRAEAEDVSLKASKIYRDLIERVRKVEGLADAEKQTVNANLADALGSVDAAITELDAIKPLLQKIKGPQDEKVMRPLILGMADAIKKLEGAKASLEHVKKMEAGR